MNFSKLRNSFERSVENNYFSTQSTKNFRDSSDRSVEESLNKHNLDIQQYNLKEILELFSINSYDFSLDDLKNAKRRVLMMHPDKSNLPHDYFLFYKKAFDIVVKFYSSKNKTEEEAINENLTINLDYSEYIKNYIMSVDYGTHKVKNGILTEFDSVIEIYKESKKLK